jgi:succinyl-diaminopimelate desuccinylase
MPGKGKNAHRIGMELALNLDRVFHEKYTKRDSMYDDPSSTFEPTKIEPNVPNINTVPGVDIFYFDCRVLPEYSLDDVLSDINSAIKDSRSRYEVEIALEIINREDAGPATQASSEVCQMLERSISRVTGKKASFVGIGGQTVGNLFRKEGIPTVVWSTVDDIPHEPNEYSKITNLISDAKVFAAMPLLS